VKHSGFMQCVRCRKWNADRTQRSKASVSVRRSSHGMRDPWFHVPNRPWYTEPEGEHLLSGGAVGVHGCAEICKTRVGVAGHQFLAA